LVFLIFVGKRSFHTVCNQIGIHGDIGAAQYPCAGGTNPKLASIIINLLLRNSQPASSRRSKRRDQDQAYFFSMIAISSSVRP
jgi:hypothetical protein